MSERVGGPNFFSEPIRAQLFWHLTLGRLDEEDVPFQNIRLFRPTNALDSREGTV